MVSLVMAGELKIRGTCLQDPSKVWGTPRAQHLCPPLMLGPHLLKDFPAQCLLFDIRELLSAQWSAFQWRAPPGFAEDGFEEE